MSEEHKLATAYGPGIERLSLWRRTVGRVVSTEVAPMKLQNEEMRPVRKSARSAGSTLMAQTWSNAKVTTADKYRIKVEMDAS